MLPANGGTGTSARQPLAVRSTERLAMADGWRILVTISRNWPNPPAICGELERLLAGHGTLTVVHGAAREGDSGHSWTEDNIYRSPSGEEFCRECHREAGREALRRRRETASQRPGAQQLPAVLRSEQLALI
jgi:hypothetical protein